MNEEIKVKAWKEKVTIPTYEIGQPEKYPFFLEKRVYQGSSGVVYPNPVVEHISNEKIDKEWNAIYIENKYLKIMILPELGGRIQMAYDKIKERHFVYYNHVIKPALVGLNGPWISGGIEFNWPQHHRPSTYEPIDSCIEENMDGSITVWVSEIERMFRTKGMAGFTLHSDKAYLEIKVQLYNRTPHPQTFLWWANPAVAVNDQYQTVFPPDVNAVFDHGKRDVSEFPIARGKYYKVDYSPGTDISCYKNIPVPTSYMAITSKYDFVGGYENDTKAGLLHVADNNISPGKKQWTWGNGDFGHAWDRNLTDKDGPYIELMCGVYTDNQPDFSWMHPYEEKSFKQYFMPYQNVGVVKNATKEALVNLEVEGSRAIIKIYVTANYPNCRIILSGNGKSLIEIFKNLSPENGYEDTVEIGGISLQDMKINIEDEKGNTLVSWIPDSVEKPEIPGAAKAAKLPKDIESIEQLYLTGLHLEQYRHATYDPTAYYLEALSREPGNVRNNNAMGLWFLKRGRFEKALTYFDHAIKTLTERNPNPYDGEPYFNKGICLKLLGRMDEAYKAFYKSCWNAPWQDAGYFNLSQIACIREDYQKSLELVEKGLIRNWHNQKARHLKIILLRKLGRITEAKELILASLRIDRFNFGTLYERFLMSNSLEELNRFKTLIRGNVHNYIELALDYSEAGQFKEAISVLEIYVDDKEVFYPMVSYLMANFHSEISNEEKASLYYNVASKMTTDYCFPNRLEERVALSYAIEKYPEDASANYYLGNFWYSSKQYRKAQSCWEKSNQIDSKNPICHRNLALLYYNKKGKRKLAQEHLEKAFSLDNGNARLLMELDQLYKKLNLSPKHRIENLEKFQHLCLERDDLYLERIALYNYIGNNKKALGLINKRQFHPWEGGEGKVAYQYVTSNIELGKKYIWQEDYEKAIIYLKAAKIYPNNLGEGKLFGTQENDINYWLGFAYEGLKRFSESKEFYSIASQGLSNPSMATFYNDQQPDKIFYQGLALKKLGEVEKSRLLFLNLIDYGKQHIDDEIEIDYFAISLPNFLIWEDDLKLRNKIHCFYLIGLGNLGMQKTDEASKFFEKTSSLDSCHLPTVIHKKMLYKIGI